MSQTQDVATVEAVADVAEATEGADWGIIRELGELPLGALVSEVALAAMFKRHKMSIRRACERGELPPPTRLLGQNCWTVGALRGHLERRQEDAGNEVHRLTAIGT
jgi:hypothetical protein